MIEKGSRYVWAQPFVAATGCGEVFKGIRSRPIGPAPGVLEHVVAQGDRLDRLAQYYYDDARRWWRILDANPELLNGADLSLEQWVGAVILIPRADENGSGQ